MYYPGTLYKPRPANTTFDYFYIRQYLKKGCTQYFTKNATEKTLKANQISANHRKKGNLKDPLLDDVIDFQNVDRVSGYFLLGKGGGLFDLRNYLLARFSFRYVGLE